MSTILTGLAGGRAHEGRGDLVIGGCDGRLAGSSPGLVGRGRWCTRMAGSARLPGSHHPGIRQRPRATSGIAAQNEPRGRRHGLREAGLSIRISEGRAIHTDGEIFRERCFRRIEPGRLVDQASNGPRRRAFRKLRKCSSFARYGNSTQRRYLELHHVQPYAHRGRRRSTTSSSAAAPTTPTKASWCSVPSKV